MPIPRPTNFSLLVVFLDASLFLISLIKIKMRNLHACKALCKLNRLGPYVRVEDREEVRTSTQKTGWIKYGAAKQSTVGEKSQYTPYERQLGSDPDF